MRKQDSALDFNELSPVIVGGIGGSGTRVIAEILIELGYFMGNDLNVSSDNLLFTHIFKHKQIPHLTDTDFQSLVNMYIKDMTGEKKLTPSDGKNLQKIVGNDIDITTWISKRINQPSIDSFDTRKSPSLWGWKEPNSHVIINRLKKNIPHAKYIHLIRNGYDMAHSNNQNQLKFWGEYFLNQKIENTPRYSFKYWCSTYKNIITYKQQYPDTTLLINYEDLCFQPKISLRALCAFLNISTDEQTITKLSSKIKAPNSIGRYKQFGLDIFDESDIAFLDTINKQHATLFDILV